MALTFETLFGSPDHFLHSFDGGDALFVPMDRAAYRRSIFLDDRIQPAQGGVLPVPLAALANAAGGAEARCGWIFHIAHCGSTLLARALDALGGGLVLREPLALRQAAVAGDQALLAAVLPFLARRYPGEGATIVKANVPVNFVIDRVADAMTDAPALFLYHSLDDYLLAILRSDNHRAWLRRVTGELAAHLDLPETASDAQRAAGLWLAQLRRFAQGLAALPRAAALDAERFFNDPGPVLTAATGLFGRAAPGDAVAALLAGPLFSSYAKNPAVAFDNAAREARREALRRPLAGELAEARDWLAAMGAEPPLAQLAARALV
jgi:hypothetical protein